VRFTKALEHSLTGPGAHTVAANSLFYYITQHIKSSVAAVVSEVVSMRTQFQFQVVVASQRISATTCERQRRGA